MSTVMDPGRVAIMAMEMSGEAMPSCFTTTLYALITTIQDVVSPEDDALVVTTVVSLLQSGRLTRLGTARIRERRRP